jgi:hypothetical protein
MNLEQEKNLKTIFSRQVVLFGGEYGRWKSLSLTALTFWECVVSNKDKIVSNMPLKFPIDIEVWPLVQTSQFDLSAMSQIKNSVLVWDEIMNDLKSRSAMSESNKYISQMMIGFRKDNIKLRCSLQHARTVDIYLDEITELKIIPSAKNKYSSDTQEDSRIRLQKKDFWVKWLCRDEKENIFFEVELNLYPFLNFYNTKFKPYKLVQTHKSYLEKLQEKSMKKYETHLEYAEREIEQNLENWRNGLDEITENI